MAMNILTVGCVRVRRFCFVDLILFQECIGILANVFELIEDDEIGVAVRADHFREWIVRKHLKVHREKNVIKKLNSGNKKKKKTFGIPLVVPQCSSDR